MSDMKPFLDVYLLDDNSRCAQIILGTYIWLRSAVGLTRCPVTAENTGSSPVGVAIQPRVRPENWI